MNRNRPLVIVGNPEALRTRLLREAMARQGWPPAQGIAYADLLAGRCRLADLPHRAIVRLESPGKDFRAERLLLACGAAEAEAEGSPAMAASTARELEFDRGRIWNPRQWYLGFRAALRAWHAELLPRDDLLLTARPADVETLFDKPRCHARNQAAGVPVPPTLSPFSCYDELTEQMHQRQWERVFVKLAHGSSASGAVALHRHGGRARAFTTVELVVADGGVQLYNARPVRTLADEKAIARLIDALAPHRLHAEQWLPKASLGHGVFDLRIVVIAGRPRHTVVREARSPITNLQIGNRRGSLAALHKAVSAEQWQALQETCSRVAEVYRGNLQLAVDLLLTPGCRRHVVLEVNAFGDLLPGALNEGQDTYTAELAALDKGWPDRAGDRRQQSQSGTSIPSLRPG